MDNSVVLPQLPMKIGPRNLVSRLFIFISAVVFLILLFLDVPWKLKSFAAVLCIGGFFVARMQLSGNIGPFLIIDDDGLILNDRLLKSMDMRILWSDIATIEPGFWSPGFYAHQLPLMVSTAEIMFVPGIEWTERKADLGWLAAKIGVTIYPTQMPADELIKMLRDLKAAKASGAQAARSPTLDDVIGAGA